MTAEHLAKLWLSVGLVLVFHSLNTWIVGQGGDPLFSVNLLDDRAVTSALIATPICATLLTLLCRIGLGHARRSPATARWHERMPVVGLQGLKTATLEGRLYQTFFLVLFVLLPVAALAHFTLQVLDARVFDRHGGAELAPLSVPEWGAILSTVGGDDRFRLGESAEEGVTWFPVVEPAVLGALLLIAAAHVGLLMRRLFAR